LQAGTFTNTNIIHHMHDANGQNNSAKLNKDSQRINIWSFEESLLYTESIFKKDKIKDHKQISSQL